MSLAAHVNTSELLTLNVAGRGGAEAEIAAILPGWKRVGAALHDYELRQGEKILRLEVKKQVNLQWFDVGKYYNLTEESRLIWVLFVIHKDGVVSLLLAVRLGDFVDRLCSLPNFQALGWNNDVFETAAKFKKRYPAVQFKVKAEILTIYRAHPDLFELLYDRQAIQPRDNEPANG